VGALAQFTVAVQSALPPSYQWRHDGVDLIDGFGIIGATTDTLTFNADVAAVDVYDCVVTNDCGSVTSDPAVLAVRVCQGDTDGSGEVDFNDLIATLFLFGPCE